jgi:hypothetical protein
MPLIVTQMTTKSCTTNSGVLFYSQLFPEVTVFLKQTE